MGFFFYLLILPKAITRCEVITSLSLLTFSFIPETYFSSQRVGVTRAAIDVKGAIFCSGGFLNSI
jgi:hypothetical protein